MTVPPWQEVTTMSCMTQQTGTASEQGRIADLRGLCRWGGFASFGLLLYCLGLLVQTAVVGIGAPSDPAAIFAMLHSHKIEALLRLELATMVAMPLYYLVFLGLFAALRSIDFSNSVLATSLAFAGNTLILATPTALPVLRLSEMFYAASTEAQKGQYLAAAQAVMATDIWHHTGAVIGGVLLQTGAVVICVVMLRGGIFGRTTAWLGIVMHGLDLGHILCSWFVPLAGAALMAAAGVLYPFWFYLIGRKLLQLARRETTAPSAPSLASGG